MAQELRKMKKFRFQLLAEWLVVNHAPCRAADVGGGKGLMSVLLSQAGWNVTVIDPGEAGRSPKYRDPKTGAQVRLSEVDLAKIRKVQKPFGTAMAQDFDLLIGLHTHGSNMKIIQAAANYQKDFIILPCCVIDEPITPQPNINWLDSLEEYAISLGHEVKRVELHFKGQNIGLHNFQKQAFSH